LVNAHAHLELTPFRGLLEDRSFRPWILGLMKARDAVMTPERRRAAARVGIAEGLLAGITTFADVSDSGASLMDLVGMGVRGRVYVEVFGPDPGAAPTAIANLREQVDALRRFATDRVSVGVSPHAPYSVSDALFRATATLAQDESLPVTVHIAESDAESRLVTEGEGEFADAWRKRGIQVAPRAPTPIALLEATGVLAAQPLLIHAVRSDRTDWHRMKDHGCRIAHCPASNAKLGHGVAPLASWLDLDIPVGLGSDSVASSNRMDLLDEARLAILQQRSRLGDGTSLPARQALELATLGGARALGLDHIVGTIEPGKAADLVAFPLCSVADTPSHSPEDALVFGAAGRRPRLVLIDGQELVRDGALHADVRADADTLQSMGAELREAAGRLPS
jgi:5-methylthioadenosine/S-adenosylhomocysteine deaminase